MSPSQQPGGAAAGPLINFLVAYEGSGRGHHLRAPLTDGFACCNCAATGAAEAPFALHFKGQQPVVGLQLCSCSVLKSSPQRAIPRHQRQALRPVRRVG